MSQYPPSQQMQSNPDQPQKSWFGRNWWWVVLLIVLLPVLCCGGFLGLGWWGFNKGMEEVKKMPPYADSIRLVETDPRAQLAIGSPVEAAGMIEAVQQGHPFNATATDFDAEIPVSGPLGSGVLVVDAELDASSGNWSYKTQQLELPDGTVIDFLGPSTPDEVIDSISE